MMKRMYAVTMENGDVYGIPAEVIADNYAVYYASRGGGLSGELRYNVGMV